jgi:uncharacterized phage-associated protein
VVGVVHSLWISLGAEGDAMTVSAHDVAAYILDRMTSMSSMKLQKLVYYSQAWHLVWDDEPLFHENIQAWANGPVVYELFDQHRGNFSVSKPWPVGDTTALSKSQMQTIDIICDHYGKLSGQELSALTHSEDPWLLTRRSLGSTQRSAQVIPLDRMERFYTALSQADDAEMVDEIDWSDYRYDEEEEEERKYHEEEARRYYEDDAPDPRDFM